MRATMPRTVARIGLMGKSVALLLPVLGAFDYISRVLPYNSQKPFLSQESR